MREYGQDGQRRDVAFYVVTGLVLLTGLSMLGFRYFSGDDEPSGVPISATPVVEATTVADDPAMTPSPEPTATPTPTATPSAEPTPTPEPTEPAGPAQTVLFEGGPATGPWQQLGTVAEITHPDAPQTARYSYTNFWSDPEEENQPDELWDELVRSVTAQLSELGDPIEGTSFGSAEGSEPFNASGGIQNIYRGDGVFTAQWNAMVEDDQGRSIATYAYLVSFDGDVVEVMPPFEFREESGDFRAATDDAVARIQAWASDRGFTECESCS